MTADKVNSNESVSETENKVTEFSVGNNDLMKSIIKDAVSQGHKMMSDTLGHTIERQLEDETRIMIDRNSGKAVEQANESKNLVIDQINHAVSEGQDIVEQALETAQAAVKQESKELIDSCKNQMADKMNQSVDKLETAIPILEHAGYHLTTLDMDIGILPTVVARFAKVKDISEQEEQKMLEQYSDNIFVSIMLNSLFKANHIQRHIKIADLYFQEVEMHISTIPKLKLRFRKRSA